MKKIFSTIFGFFGFKKEESEKKQFPRAKGIICIEKSIYPKDKPQMGRLGNDEWYGQ